MCIYVYTCHVHAWISGNMYVLDPHTLSESVSWTQWEATGVRAQSAESLHSDAALCVIIVSSNSCAPFLPPSPLMFCNHPSIWPNTLQWCPHSCLRGPGHRDTCQSLSHTHKQTETQAKTNLNIYFYSMIIWLHPEMRNTHFKHPIFTCLTSRYRPRRQHQSNSDVCLRASDKDL